MFFVNVQSSSVSQRVLFLDSLFCYPIMFSLNHAAIFVWIFSRAFHDFLHSHIRSCLSQHHHCYLTALHHRLLRCCNPAVVIFSLHRRFRCCDVKALAFYTAAQIVTSPSYAFWRDSLLSDGRHHIDYRPHLRATHCPVRVIRR